MKEFSKVINDRSYFSVECGHCYVINWCENGQEDVDALRCWSCREVTLLEGVDWIENPKEEMCNEVQGHKTFQRNNYVMALEAAIEAVLYMPLETKIGGGSGDETLYPISNGTIWGLGIALERVKCERDKL